MSVKLKLNQALINGDFSYFQRGVSFAAITDLAYTADRWQYTKNGTMVHTISRSSDVPSSAFGIYSLLATPTTAQASILAGNYIAIQQKIEGNMLRAFKGKKLILSFYVKAYKTGTYCVSFRNGDNTKSLIKEYTINASNTWEQKTIRITHDASGTWLYDTGVGMNVSFVIAAGSTFQGSKDAWLSGNYMATSNQANGVDNILDTFQITDVCLVEDNDGQTRTPDFTLAARDVFGELLLCQRYYEKSYDLTVAPGTAGATGRIGVTAGDATNVLPPVRFLLKRATPIVTLYNQGTGTSGQIRRYTGSTSLAATASTPSLSTTGDIAATVVAGALYDLHFTADAELT